MKIRRVLVLGDQRALKKGTNVIQVLLKILLAVHKLISYIKLNQYLARSDLTTFFISNMLRIRK